MSVRISGYEFEGPYENPDSLRDNQGVYCILDRRGQDNLVVLDAGESIRIKSRVENHDRKLCWSQNKRGMVLVSAYYTPGLSELDRRVIERKIRDQYEPPCGEL